MGWRITSHRQWARVWTIQELTRPRSIGFWRTQAIFSLRLIWNIPRFQFEIMSHISMRWEMPSGSIMAVATENPPDDSPFIDDFSITSRKSPINGDSYRWFSHNHVYWITIDDFPITIHDLYRSKGRFFSQPPVLPALKTRAQLQDRAPPRSPVVSGVRPQVRCVFKCCGGDQQRRVIPCYIIFYIWF